MTKWIDWLKYNNQTTLSPLSIETDKTVNFTKVKIEEVLDENQKIKVLYHSVLNILNQIYWFLQLIDLSCSSFSETIKKCRFLIDYILWNSKPDFQITLNTLLELKMHFFSELNQVSVQNLLKDDKFFDYFSILLDIFEKLDEKTSFISQWDFIYMPSFISIEHLVEDLKNVCDIISKISDKKIVFDKNLHTKSNQLIIYDSPNSYLVLPPILKDVIRDLVLNSRKYSNSWTSIKINIIQDPNLNLRIKISDEWFWIEQSELNKIFEYGYKSLNNSNTSWFWIWLSKVYEVVKHLWWNIFIKSKLWIWTSIVLTLKGEKIRP